MGLFDLTGKSARVTGGTRGIGLMIARGLLDAGARVAISSRKADACDATAGEPYSKYRPNSGYHFLIEQRSIDAAKMFFRKYGHDFHKAVAKCLGDRNALLLRNHGIVAAGRTLEEAVWVALKLERACRVQLMAEWAGGPKHIAEGAILHSRRLA